MNRPARYRLFFWLLDLATLATLVSVGRYLYSPQLILAGDNEGWWAQLTGVLAVLLPAALIFGRALRDEFAEGLWQAAAGTTIRGLIILPFALLFFWGVADGLAGAPQSDPSALINGTQMLALMVTLQLTLFVLALQWHRWRAMRG